MTLHAILFYITSCFIIMATGIAITRKNMVHTVLFLVLSFFGSAMLFYLMGAPLLAALEIIIYAGAIMVLFLFLIMMLKMESGNDNHVPTWQYVASGGMGMIFLIFCFLMVQTAGDQARQPMEAAVVTPASFGKFLYQHHWLSIEVASLLLLIALIGALHLGMGKGRASQKKGDDK